MMALFWTRTRILWRQSNSYSDIGYCCQLSHASFVLRIRQIRSGQRALWKKMKLAAEQNKEKDISNDILEVIGYIEERLLLQ